MKSSPYLRLILVFPLLLSGAMAQNAAVIWNGFEHNWGYNHRINRIGSLISEQNCTNDSCRALNIHSAASGSGADEVAFRGYYSQVFAPEVDFRAGSTELELRGKEGEMIRATKEIHLQVPSFFDGIPHQEVVLNGFDLVTIEGLDADKIIHFRVSAGELKVDSSRSEIDIVISAEMIFSCSTPECKLFDDEVGYRLSVEYLVISGGESFHSTSGTFEKNLKWEKKQVPISPDESFTILGQPGFEGCAFAFKSFGLTLDKELHLLDWSNFIEKGEVEANGLCHFRLGLQFRTGSPDMENAFRKNYAGKIKLSPRLALMWKPGSALLQSEVCLLQFKQGKSKSLITSGSHFWETQQGNQSAANSKNAVSKREIYFLPLR